MSQPKNPPLAIIGIGCRFPGGAEDPEAFWNLLINGKSGIVQTPEDRWNVERYYHEDSSIPVKMHTKWGGFVKNVDQFDAAFFGISPREAQRMDPQQRWLLETAWEALEDGGIRPQDARGTKTGVFVGIASNEYGSIQMMSEEDIDVHTNSGSTLSIASNRISYLFDLKGPSVSVDTACSSALVAVNLACRSIWSGDCEMALAGGVNALLMPDASIGFSKASMLSPSGQCFAFDDRANGYVRGEGAGMIAIKPLDKAIEDGDPIYATIRASVINQDGNTSSMTVPGEDSQAAMLEQAYDEAGLEPSAVCYMEAHGTGTPVGDPIETRALGRVLSRGRDESNKCIIGSVKTNIGHLESGSGIAGLVKAALVLHKDTVPPNLNFKNPNPNIPFEEMKLKVPTEPTPLPHQNGALPVTAVNSFGFGGTNAHIVLEQYDGPNARAEKAPAEKAPSRPYILPISAGSETSLENYARAYRDFLKGERDIDISEICYSAATHKNQHEEQICITGESRAEIRRRLSAWLSPARDTTGIVTKKKAITNTAPVFVFTGQGAQWWAMGQELLEREPVFRATIEKIDAELSKLADWSLLEEMTRDQESSRINETNIAQPAIFALQVALAELWKSWGVEPEKVVGHSVGEVAAAYVAGAYSLEDAAKIIFHRSRLQHTTGGKGRMVAVGISPAEGRSVIRGREAQVQVAVINSPSMITLAGDTEVLEPIVAELEEKGRFVRWLRIDYAFHTHQMDPIKDELLDVLGDITANPTKVPFISTVTGREVSGEELDGHYWWRNVREPVLFAPAVAHLIQDGAELFLELGPHPALESSINECLSEQSAPGAVLHSLKRKTDESAQLMRNAAGLFLQGAKLDWKALVGANGEFVRLPRYPWNRDRFWLEGEESRNHRLAPFDHVLLGVRQPSPAPAWQFFLDPRYFKYLEDHRFWDSIVFPAAGYAEIGLAVAKQLFPDDPYAVEELVTKKALFVSEKNVPEVRVTWNEELKMFAVHSRTDSGEWELNAEGRLTKVPFSEESGDLEQIRLALPTHFDHERYYEEYEKAGYQFGPNFQEVRDAWRKDHECLARIVVPEFVRESMHEYRFHPAVLDACFHAVKGAQVIPADGKPSDYFYLPAAIRRVHIYREPLPATLWAHAKVIFDDYASVLADIAVYDEDGNRVADILGFRVDRVDQKDEAEESLDQSFYQFQFEPAWLKGSRAKSKPAFPGGAELVEIANTEAKPIFEKNGLDFYFKELEPATHAMALAYIAQAYESLDFEWTPGKAIELDAFVAATEIPGDHRRLVRAQLNALCETGSIESTGRDSWVIKAPFNLGDPEKLREATKTKFPQFDADTDLCSMCGRALKGIIGGDIDPLEVLFPGGSTSPELHRFYVEGADFPSQNTLLTNVIQGAIKDWPARRAIRVLEVGAGTGSLTRSIAPILPADRSEYLFTDNGAGFLSEAKKAFADFPFIDFASFDIEKDPGEQNIPVGEFDLVLATNVVHATSDLKNTLAQLKKTLAPGGRLIFLEVTRPRAELDIVFGLLKGWWYYKDTDLRPDCALLSPDRWTALLEDCGYDDACWYDNIPQDTGWKAGQSVLIAQRPLNDTVSAEVEAETKPAVTIVGKADKLKAALENIGHTVNVVAPIYGSAYSKYIA
ncbi:MAG: beta-ketoacyl synthase N-terminal-like domain-containing protein [Verrucomicrobiota bacterium]